MLRATWLPHGDQSGELRLRLGQAVHGADQVDQVVDGPILLRLEHGLERAQRLLRGSSRRTTSRETVAPLLMAPQG